MQGYQSQKRIFFVVWHYLFLGAAVMLRSTFAGFPATIVFAGTSFVTTLPAPTSAFSPITILDRTVLPEPMEAPFFTIVASTFQSFSDCRCPSRVVARG